MANAEAKVPCLPKRRDHRKESLAVFQKKPKKPKDLSDEQFNEIMNTFKLIDANQDGRISKKELRDAAFVIGMNPTSKEVDSWWQIADTDGDGFISAEEYIEVMKTNYVSIDIEQERMQAAFSVLDKNGDGFITLDELRCVLKYKNSISLEEIDAIFKEIDVSGKGYIDFNDFVHSKICAKIF